MFKAGDLVDINERNDLDFYGKISEIKDDKAVVHLKFVRHPKGRENGTCESCGCPGFFSVNSGTGEIVCMRTGCGHGYGFIERDEIVRLDKLINITEKRNEEKKQKRISEIKSCVNTAKREIEKAMKEGTITENDKDEILRTLK